MLRYYENPVLLLGTKRNWSGVQSFNFHEWPKQTFSVQYHYIIKQKSNENKAN